MEAEELKEQGRPSARGRGGNRAGFTGTLVLQVRIAKQLTLGRTVNPKDIAILTPYNAQVAEISKSLMREGVTGVTVCSITKSQGEAGSGPGDMRAEGSGGGHRPITMSPPTRERVALCAGEHRAHLPRE